MIELKSTPRPFSIKLGVSTKIEIEINFLLRFKKWCLSLQLERVALRLW